MSGVRYYVNEKTIKKDGKAAIYVMVYMDGKSIKINSGVSVDYTKFDQAKGIIKGNTKDDQDNNLIIAACMSQINEIQVRYRLQNKLLTPDLLVREYKNPTFYVDFLAWMDLKLKERVKEKELAAESEKYQRVCLNKLKKFRKELSFAEIDLKFLTLFRNYCRKTLKNDVNTAAKTLGYLQIYMNIAKREEIITMNPFDNFSFSRIEPVRLYLTELELLSLIKIYDSTPIADHLHRTLRHFLFMALTGIRISDFIRMKKTNVNDNVLKFVPFKTRAKKRAECHVPLIQKALSLIKDEDSKTEFLFETITEQKMNDQIKLVAGIAKINKEISNHSARHTFATIFLNKTHDVATLQKILGHSNIRETMMYVHISTNEIDEQMLNFDKLLSLT